MNVILRPSLRPYPEISLPDVLAQSTSRFPDKIAAVHGSRTATFEELNTRCNRIALDLVALGVQPGQRVALMGQNSIEYIAAFFGILKAGGVVVPFSPAYSAREIGAQLRDCEPSAAIVDADLIELFVVAGGAALAGIKRAFGEAFILPSGAMDREKMRKRVFSDPGAKKSLDYSDERRSLDGCPGNGIKFINEDIFVFIPQRAEFNYLFDKLFPVNEQIKQREEHNKHREDEIGYSFIGALENAKSVLRKTFQRRDDYFLAGYFFGTENF